MDRILPLTPAILQQSAVFFFEGLDTPMQQEGDSWSFTGRAQNPFHQAVGMKTIQQKSHSRAKVFSALASVNLGLHAVALKGSTMKVKWVECCLELMLFGSEAAMPMTLRSWWTCPKERNLPRMMRRPGDWSFWSPLCRTAIADMPCMFCWKLQYWSRSTWTPRWVKLPHLAALAVVVAAQNLVVDLFITLEPSRTVKNQENHSSRINQFQTLPIF